MWCVWIEQRQWMVLKGTHLNATVTHKDSLEVEQARRPENVLTKDAHVVPWHPEDLDFMVQIGWHGGETLVGAICFPLPVGPLTLATLRAVVGEIRTTKRHQKTQ